ncbi:hypothetical protein [Rubritalea squalenifaciens]|nr:hypothetical protein [Rubritalea squalenifaciens]
MKPLACILLSLWSCLPLAAQDGKQSKLIQQVEKKRDKPAVVELNIPRLLPFDKLEDKSKARENANMIAAEILRNKIAVSRQQFEHYCGTPDGISVDGDLIMTAYFYMRDDAKKLWVMYAFYKNGKLSEIGYNDASVNDHSKMRKLRPEKFPK